MDVYYLSLGPLLYGPPCSYIGCLYGMVPFGFVNCVWVVYFPLQWMARSSALEGKLVKEQQYWLKIGKRPCTQALTNQ